VPHHSSEGCSAVLDFLPIFPETDKKLVSVPLCPDHSKNAQFAICMVKIQVIMYDALNTPVREA
jgi:hypothetical protein